MKTIKVGTDFSGIGAPEQALKNLKIPYTSVFACDIDKYARQTFLANHEVETMYEDITTRNHKEVEKLDLYVAGFPCQSFSIAGQRKGFDETRGTLFFNVAEFIKENQPAAFILENVKGLVSHDSGRTMQTILDVLSNGGGTVNSQMSLDMFDDGLGYHINHQILNTKEHGIPQNRERVFIVGFKEPRNFRFPKTEPLILGLKDLLDEDVDEKYYLTDKQVEAINNSKHEHSARVFDTEGCAPTIMAKSGGGHEPYIYAVADYRADEGLRIRKDGISPCLNTKLTDGDFTLKRGQCDILLITDRIRRLTPNECMRLQNFPDNFIKPCSPSQTYKQAGNSITVRVIQKIIENVYHV